MSENDTHMVLTGLNTDTEYNVKFYYTTIDKETKETITTKFEEVNLRTKKPEYSVAVYRVSGISKSISYKVYLQNGYPIDKINVSYSFSYNDVDDEGEPTIKNKTLTREIAVSSGSKVVTDSFSIKDYDLVNNSIVRINVDSVSSGDKTIAINSYTTFKIGG